MLGLAVLTHNSLVHYSSKLYKEKWSQIKSSMILSSLASCIRDYNISVLVLSIPTTGVQSKEKETLYHLIKRLAYEQKIRIEEIDTREIKLLCGEAQKKTKRSQMEILSRIYEELQPFYFKEIRNKNKYYEKMFDAVGVATIQAYRG